MISKLALYHRTYSLFSLLKTSKGSTNAVLQNKLKVCTSCFWMGCWRSAKERRLIFVLSSLNTQFEQFEQFKTHLVLQKLVRICFFSVNIQCVIVISTLCLRKAYQKGSIRTKHDTFYGSAQSSSCIVESYVSPSFRDSS